MSRRFLGGLVVCTPLLIGSPTLAHHAIQAQFDFSKEMQLTGVLTRVEWINPHAHFVMDVKDASGKVTTYRLETLGPGGLRRAGLSRVGVFKVGETHTANVYNSRDGSPLVWLKDITDREGRKITIWFGDPNPQ